MLKRRYECIQSSRLLHTCPNIQKKNKDLNIISRSFLGYLATLSICAHAANTDTNTFLPRPIRITCNLVYRSPFDEITSL